MENEKYVLKCTLCRGVVENQDGYEWVKANKARQMHYGKHNKVERSLYDMTTMIQLVPHASINVMSNLC